MFCEPQINPSSSSDWVLNNTKTRVSSTDENNQIIPIPSFSLGSDFNTEFLAIEITVNNAKEHWSSGGYLYQKFDYPGLSITKNVYYLKLNPPNLINLHTDDDYQYELIYFPRKYFKTVTVKIWRYVGEVINPNLGTNDSDIETRLAALEDKINLLL